MKTNKDLLKIVEKYKGLWVALSQSLTHVIAVNKSAKKAYTDAVKKGETQPTLFKVPQKNLPYFGTGFVYGKA